VFVTELRDSVVFSVSKTVFSTFDVYCAYGSAHTFSHLNYMNLLVHYLIRSWILQDFGQVRLCKVGRTVRKICFVSDFILHTAYTADACALTSILPSLSLMWYIVRRTQKRSLRRFRASVSIFIFIWISLLHNVVKRVRKRTARFCSVFGRTDGYGVRKNWVSLGFVMSS